MANQPESLALFKNLAQGAAERPKGGKPKEGEPEPPIVPEVPPTPDELSEFPLGEYENTPVFIDETPKPIEPIEESGTPPPEEIQSEQEPIFPQEPVFDENYVDPGDEELPPLPPMPQGLSGMNEIEMLKQRALLMGIRFSNNISAATLKTKIQARIDGEVAREAAASILNGEPIEPEEEPAVTVQTNTANARQAMHDQEMRLIRLRITNLDPKKKDLPGEIFTVANRVLGAVKKFIPYGEATDNGYHVPYIIYRQLKEREFLNIKTRKDRQGRTIVESGMVREFALEELPPLTQTELNRLAASQAAAAGMD